MRTLAEIIRDIHAKPVSFLRGKPFPGPLLVSQSEYINAERDLTEWARERGTKPLMGETADGTVGLLVKGVVIAVDRKEANSKEGRQQAVGVMPYKTKAIANLILNKALENGEKLRQLKLQKLLYFSCGYYLAAYGESLIDSAIEAWTYGPVVPEVYNEFRSFGSKGITRMATEFDMDAFDFVPVPIPANDERIGGVLDFVWNTYGKYTGLQLSDMTHRIDSPWDKTRKKNPGIKNADISDEMMLDYFSKFVKKTAAA